MYFTKVQSVPKLVVLDSELDCLQTHTIIIVVGLQFLLSCISLDDESVSDML